MEPIQAELAHPLHAAPLPIAEIAFKPTAAADVPIAAVVTPVSATAQQAEAFDVALVELPPVGATAAPASQWLWRGILAIYRGVASFLHGTFGVLSIIAGLSVLASIPILNLLSLGYLFEVSGRVARTGRISDALVGVHKASRIGSIILGGWLVMSPARFLAGYWYDAWLIAPGSIEEKRLWRATLVVLTLSALYVFWAWVRGGRFRDFLWPAPIRFLKTIFTGRLWADAADGCWEFVISLRLLHYFSLGFRGFVGTSLWLLPPIVLFIAGAKTEAPVSGVLNFTGAAVMSFVLIYLPFAQAHFAAENRFAALFDLRTVRNHFRRAPIFFWLALLITVAFALPLYLAKIEYLPRELLFLPGILFVAFAFPSRALTGWAVGYARRRPKPRFFLFRWASRLAMIPVALIYVLVLYLSQFTSWSGVYSLFEQHAFLFPAPFLSN